MSDGVNPVHIGVRPKGWVLIVLLLTCSLVINLLLSRRVSTLNRIVASLESENSLNIGIKVPPIEGRVLNPGFKDIEFGKVSVPTVIYVFRPDCSWCKKNLDNLRALITASGPRYRIVGLSLPSTSTNLTLYLQATQLQFPVYTDIAEATKLAYHLGATPETIVVSPQSKVLKVWIGAYQDPMLKDIENYLRVQLPGCCQTLAKGS